MKTHSRAAVVLLGAVALAVTGCGPSEKPAAAPSSTATTTAPKPTPLGAVQVGDCVLNADLGAGKLYGVSTLTVVDCDTPDSAPVVVAGPFKSNIRRGDGATDADIPYMGFPSMYFVAVDECTKLQGIANPQKTLNHAFPDEATWEAGDHVIVCVDPDRATGTYMW
ncbi:hypothetical protein [Gordonia caeni]|uniref:Septum formation-related domain-containing protein n=1 Tax=Gordonia caeni TaxID=1007097 RepID=A0ABP7P964_9ACTN